MAVREVPPWLNLWPTYCNLVDIMSYNLADRSTRELCVVGTNPVDTQVVPLTTVRVDAAVVQESNPEVVQDSRFVEEAESG